MMPRPDSVWTHELLLALAMLRSLWTSLYVDLESPPALVHTSTSKPNFSPPQFSFRWNEIPPRCLYTVLSSVTVGIGRRVSVCQLTY
ncbi:hypothetical protein DFH08DRAFT_875796 [Mycena albidolilacea]|uniref:Secreted protein n=1 Tax=Mycena albidolilacea TaxID=1033008 RepID=A0AAD7EMD6_9AGAR|nr:hypothetical protein DFH08DRAFT_875796 [Mycena albidolilacea]